MRWLERLQDLQTRAAIVSRLWHIAAGHMWDCRSLGGGLHELDWHLGPGYRVYSCRQGERVILLLAGGEKSTRERDIGRARQLAKEYE